MKLKLLTLIALTFTLRVQAGEIVVCRNSSDSITSTELLDFYEGRVNRNIPHVFESNISNEEYFTKFRDQADVLFDSYHNDELLKMALKLSEAITAFRSTGRTNFKGFIFTSEQLTKSSNDSLVMPPKDCEIEKALTQLRPAMPGDPEFIVQKEIIKNLSEDGVRGLITHAVLVKYLNQFMDLRYTHQKLSAVSINELNFRYLFNALKKQLPVIGGYSIKLMSELPTGELFYDQSYVLTDNGRIDESKTLIHGVFKTKWELDANGKRWNLATPMPTGSIVTLQYEDGTIVETRITDKMHGHTENVQLKHGKIKIHLYIPGQVVRPRLGVFEQSLEDLDFQIGDTTVFNEVKVGLRAVNLTRIVEVGLNERSLWNVKLSNED